MTVSLPLSEDLLESRFVQRYNRFLLQVALELTGELVDVHMADPGRLKELLLPGKRVWLRPASNRQRKTRWTAVLVESPNGEELVSLDTTLPNRLIGKALGQNAMPEFAGWRLERSEAPLGRSRIDFLLTGDGSRRLFLEVKSVTLVQEGVGLFPDAVTARGARHLRELTAVAGEERVEAAVLFVLQRRDATRIRAARAIDPAFADALEDAKSAGVRILGRRCFVSVDGVELGSPVPAEVG